MLVRALGTSWRVRVSELTQVANRCSSVVVSNWTLRQLYASRRVNSLLTEQSSYNFNSVILFSTFTRLTAYNWRRVQFETTTLAHLLASCVKLETRTSQLAASALSKSSGVWCGHGTIDLTPGPGRLGGASSVQATFSKVVQASVGRQL